MNRKFCTLALANLNRRTNGAKIGIFGGFNRTFHLSANNLVSKEFDNAKARLTQLKDDPGNEAKLKLYGLFKQATIGPCNAPKPGMMDFVGKAKWNAWSQLGNLSQQDAEKQYIDYVNELGGSSKNSDNATPTQNNQNTSSGQYNEIITSIEYGNVYKIVLNRPNKKNAINTQMYNELKAALREADKNENVLFCCITGAGDYYSSGNDLGNFAQNFGVKSQQELAKDGRDFLEEVVNAFIDFSKPIIGIINGPSVGISFTLLGLFDLVYANEKATFHAPFTKLAQSPEACSSYTFPIMMGTAKASDILVFNRKITAKEAYERNIVSEVIGAADFEKNVYQKIEEFSKLPKNSFHASRNLMRQREKEKLKLINKQECDCLMERWSSEEFLKAIGEFFSRNSKA